MSASVEALINAMSLAFSSLSATSFPSASSSFFQSSIVLLWAIVASFGLRVDKRTNAPPSTKFRTSRSIRAASDLRTESSSDDDEVELDVEVDAGVDVDVEVDVEVDEELPLKRLCARTSACASAMLRSRKDVSNVHSYRNLNWSNSFVLHLHFVANKREIVLFHEKNKGVCAPSEHRTSSRD
jgi:hypothetical protein